MFGPLAGCLASALLLLHPVFWVAGIVNPVRTFLVVIAGAMAVLGWRCLTEAEPKGWFYALSLALGLLAGFRLESLLLLFPWWVVAGVYRRVSARVWITRAQRC